MTTPWYNDHSVRGRRTTWALALTLTLTLALPLATGACAAKGENELRASWNKAVEKAAVEEREAAGDATKKDGKKGIKAESEWGKLGRFVDEVSDRVALGLATVKVVDLVEELCDGTPDTETLDDHLVYHCTPGTVRSVLGHTLTLELGENGVVGLVAMDLSGADSQTLLDETLTRADKWCEQPLEEAPRAENAHVDFHTCITAAGPALVLGRFPEDLEHDEWQFSLTVLIPG